MNTKHYGIYCYPYKTPQYSPIFCYDVTTGLTVKDIILLGFQAFPQSKTQIYRQKKTH